MKKLLIAATALGSLAVAAPASAQYANQNGYANVNAGGGIQNRIARLDARIQMGVQNGTIDRSEARSLRQQLREIERRERQYSRNGLSQQERADLQQRVRMFRDQLAMADGRGQGQYGNNGYQDGYNGQGGPYDAYCEDNGRSSGGLGGLGGLGGIIDSIFGGGGNNGDCATTLRVGQRASGNLYGVPTNLRYRYRDGGGVYYRSDGRNIYQIDARTNTVLRVYDAN